MEKIIETIKANKKELVSQYISTTKEIESLVEGLHKAMKEDDEKTYIALEMKRSYLNSKRADLKMAINDLVNAIYHLGGEMETFWG